MLDTDDLPLKMGTSSTGNISTLMHALRCLCLSLLMLTGSVLSVAADGSIAIGTGLRGGNDYSAGGAICRVLNRAVPQDCRVLQTGGSVDNLYALDLRDANFAIVQSDVAGAARTGEAEIAGEYAPLRSVASIYAHILTVVVRADSDIGRLADLRGRRVAAGTEISGMRWTFRTLLNGIGLRTEDLAMLVERDALDTGRALCGGSLDAVVMMTGHPSVAVSRMAESCPVRIVALSLAEVQALTGAESRYRPLAVPPGLYSFAPQPIPTVGADMMLLTHASVSEAQVERVLSALFGADGASGYRPAPFDPRPLPQGGIAAPLHPAAAQFYRENGFWR